MSNRPIYLDCAATTPIEPEVEEVMLHYMREEFGNAGSRTHEYGTKAKQGVQKARDQVARVVGCQREEVIFTSGATESNNLATLGLRKFAQETGRKHIISTNIEHKAILEPLQYLQREHGFEVDLAPVHPDGIVPADEISRRLRPDTLLVSVMHVNNETGIIQPITEIAELLKDHPAYFHTDAAQSFGKLIEPLQNPRIDLISLSGHKIYGPKGVGAFVTRRRRYRRPPLSPLMFGGGQEFGLRPGTNPVFLVAGLGVAAELALKYAPDRRGRMEEIGSCLTNCFVERGAKVFLPSSPKVYGLLPLLQDGVDSECFLLEMKDLFAASNGAACTSTAYEGSYVVRAIAPDAERNFIRLSWSYHLDCARLRRNLQLSSL